MMRRSYLKFDYLNNTRRPRISFICLSFNAENAWNVLCKLNIKILYVIYLENDYYYYWYYYYLLNKHARTRLTEPSVLESLVRSFIFSPLSFLIRLLSVDWPSWRSERHWPSFSRFPLGKSFCHDHTCFNSYFDLSSWVQLSDSTFARGRSEEDYLQQFVSRETYAGFRARAEDNSWILVFVILNLPFGFLWTFPPMAA